MTQKKPTPKNNNKGLTFRRPYTDEAETDRGYPCL